MNHLPLFVQLENRHCLVIGGGSVAERKTRELVASGALVTVISPTVTIELERLSNSGTITLEREPFSDSHLHGSHVEGGATGEGQLHADRRTPPWLILAATADRELNQRVAKLAERHRILCNVVDNPDLCTFIMPAVVERGPVTIAISTGGQSPVLARWLKGLIESVLPSRLGALATLAGRWRQRAADVIPDLDQRRRFWEQLLAGPMPDHCYTGRDQQAEAFIEQALATWHDDDANTAGEAYIVGAGPGSADLITLRGKQLLSQAEVVLYDRLVGVEVLSFARRDAELISVGKQVGQPSITQEQINRLLVQLVSRGKRVCRLKGGDPMIFGRGGEELEALAAAGLPFQVVPGITAVTACAAYAGIPLTLRGIARSVVLTTGQLEQSDQADIGPLRADQTLAIYMGVAQYREIAERLLENGTDAALPVAVIEQGASPSQRVLRTVLGELAEAAEKLKVKPPALLLVGETTQLAERYSWFAPERFVLYKSTGKQLKTLKRVS
jgi:uroporphyrin-III C-methyltransferase/precorrin-2 dehydrogenase/sirohydrochlorin ferrochelatase